MELNKVQQLLDRYFEGETSLQEEQDLRTYFTGTHVAPEVHEYVGMFSAFAKASEETLKVPVQYPKPKRSYAWLSVAASVVIVVGMSIFISQQASGHDYGTYKDPEVAALKAKQALGLMSQMLAQSTDQLNYVNEFDKVTTKYLK